MSERTRKIEIIQALRGIAALGIVYYHTEYGLWKSANWGVDFFFILSGYFLMKSTETSTGGYWKNKLIKLIPIYYVMTFVVVVGYFVIPSAFRSTTVNCATLLKSIAFIPFTNGNGDTFPLYAIGWTLNLEVFYYVIFYISMRINHKSRGVIAAGITCCIILLGMYFKPDSTALRFWSRPQLIDFVIGVAIYKFDESIAQEKTKIRNQTAYFGITIVFILLFFGKYILGDSMRSLWDFWNVLWCTVLFCLGLQLRTTTLNRLLPLKRLGDMSYSIYMTHFVIVRLVCRDLGTKYHNAIGLMIVLVTMALSIGCSVIMYQIFEVEISKILKEKFIKTERAN